VKKELVNRKGKIKMHEQSVRSLLKNIIGRSEPGRLSQGDVKKEIANHKGKIKVHEGPAEKPAQTHYWPLLAGEAKPRGCDKIVSEPTGENQDP
jgi:hypothetical protein